MKHILICKTWGTHWGPWGPKGCPYGAPWAPQFLHLVLNCSFYMFYRSGVSSRLFCCISVAEVKRDFGHAQK